MEGKALLSAWLSRSVFLPSGSVKGWPCTHHHIALYFHGRLAVSHRSANDSLKRNLCVLLWIHLTVTSQQTLLVSTVFCALRLSHVQQWDLLWSTARSEEWIVSIWLSPATEYGCRRVINRGFLECKFRSAAVLGLAMAPHWLPFCHPYKCTGSCHPVYSQAEFTQNGHSQVFHVIYAWNDVRAKYVSSKILSRVFVLFLIAPC